MVERDTVVVPGNHDGVHLGHRALLDAARACAGASGSTLALFFDPHPAHVLAPDREPPRLTTAARRQELLVAAGADRAVAWRFDREFASLSPESFVRQILVDRLAIAAIVVGPDFRFGHRRAGDLATLRDLGAANGFGVETVEPIVVDGERISSSRIRGLVAGGDVEAAARLLDRHHECEGEVVEGHRRGRTIGFSTANLDCDPVLLPADGVYAVWVRRLGADSELLGGVANLGVRPTLGAGRSVEVHLFDFDGDLYGTRLRVGFAARIRDERKFDGLDALKAQIARDASEARQRLAASRKEQRRWL